MAVQRKHTTRSKRGMRRSHNALDKSALSTDVFTGETHLRHHITPEGYYRGRRVIEKQEPEHDEEELTDKEE